MEIGTADTAPDESGVLDNGFHETILGTTQNLVFIRFIHTACGVISGINDNPFSVAVNQQENQAGQNIVGEKIPVIGERNLYMGNQGTDHAFSIPGHFRCLYSQKILEHFLHDIFSAETVNKIENGIPPTDLKGTADEIKTLINLKSFIEISLIFFHRSSYFHYNDPFGKADR